MNMVWHDDPARQFGAGAVVAHHHIAHRLPFLGISEQTGSVSFVQPVMDSSAEYSVKFAADFVRPGFRVKPKPCGALVAVGSQEVCGKRILQTKCYKLPSRALLPMRKLFPVDCDRRTRVQEIRAHSGNFHVISVAVEQIPPKGGGALLPCWWAVATIVASRRGGQE